MDSEADAAAAAVEVVAEAITPSHPLYMHPNENPSVILVQPLLNEKNFYGWKIATRRALISKNKLGLVDGTVPCPAVGHPHFSAWSQCNNMVVSWILNSISGPIAQSLLGTTSAQDIWNALHQMLSTGDFFRVSDIQEKICSIRQGRSSVTEYFTRMKILWEELMMLKPIPTCECPTTQAFRDYIEADHTISFVRGLNEGFEPVKSKILLSNPLPRIHEVYNLAIKLERQLGSTEKLTHQPVVLQSSSNNTHNTFTTQPPRRSMITNSQGSRNNNTSSVGFTGSNTDGALRRRYHCTFCDRDGHTEDRCYKKHGYPPGFQQKRQVTMVYQDDSGHNIPRSSTDQIEGSLFSPAQQAEMMRIIQRMSITPVGPSSSPHQVSAAVLSANFQQHAAGGEDFQDDWYS